MKVRVLGGDGGIAPGFQTTSFLINQSILVDAGSAATSLSLSEQKKIDTIFISHSHLDHVKDIGFLADNVFAVRKKPIQIISTPEIIQILKDHLFNNKIWPDFTVISNGTCPILSYLPISNGYEIGGLTFEICPVHHPVPAIGFIIRDKKSTIVISGDTGPTELLWQKSNQEKNLKAIFTEIAFPNKMTKVAEAAGHFTPKMFQDELSKIHNSPNFYIYHLKPEYKGLLLKEIKALKIPKLKLIKLKQRYTF